MNKKAIGLQTLLMLLVGAILLFVIIGLMIGWIGPAKGSVPGITQPGATGIFIPFIIPRGWFSVRKKS